MLLEYPTLQQDTDISAESRRGDLVPVPRPLQPGTSNHGAFTVRAGMLWRASFAGADPLGDCYLNTGCPTRSLPELPSTGTISDVACSALHSHGLDVLALVLKRYN